MGVPEVDRFHGTAPDARVLRRARVFGVAVVEAAALVRGIRASVAGAAEAQVWERVTDCSVKVRVSYPMIMQNPSRTVTYCQRY